MRKKIGVRKKRRKKDRTLERWRMVERENDGK